MAHHIMKDYELIEKYEAAEETGHVTDIHHANGCNSECDDCPASDACKQLSAGGQYSLFVVKYAKLMEGYNAKRS